MKYLILSTLLFCSLIGHSQNSHLIFFSDDHEPFFLELNGVMQSNGAFPRIKIRYYNEAGGAAKIIFADTSKGIITTELKFRTGSIAYFHIRKKGAEYVLEWDRELPYSNREDSESDHLHINYLQADGTRVEKPLSGKEYIEQYNGKKGCDTPITYRSVREYQAEITTKKNDASRLKYAIQLLNGKCLTVSQVREVMRVFESDNVRADYAISAFNYTFNQDDYKDVFQDIIDKKEEERVTTELFLK